MSAKIFKDASGAHNLGLVVSVTPETRRAPAPRPGEPTPAPLQYGALIHVGGNVTVTSTPYEQVLAAWLAVVDPAPAAPAAPAA
jgi:hypothetical protein